MMAVDRSHSLEGLRETWAGSIPAGGDIPTPSLAGHVASIARTLRQPIVTLSADWRVMEVNPAYHQTFGTKPCQIVGRPILEVDDGFWDFPAFSLLMAGICNGGSSDAIEAVFSLDSPRHLILRVTASRVRDVGSSIILLAIEDVTRHPEAGIRPDPAGRGKEDFLVMLAHELRGPIGCIDNARRLLVAGAAPEHLKWAEEVIGRQVKNLARLIEDLMDASRLRLDKVRLRRESVSLATILGRAVDAVLPTLEGRSQVLSTSIGPCPMALEGDPMRLEQMFVNLLTNASKYSDVGGHVSLAARPEAGGIVVTVTDDGQGISADLISRVFDLYTQDGRTLGHSQGGLGIGLSVAKTLAELHGGSITAASDGPGLGAAFTVRLPSGADPAMLTVQHHATPATPKGPGRRILVVEDDADTAAGMEKLLGFDGHSVRIARDEKSARELARSFLPEIILLDIGLPGGDGYELAEAFRADPTLSNPLLVAVSGLPVDSDPRRHRGHGFDHHFVKPVDFEALTQLIARSG